MSQVLLTGGGVLGGVIVVLAFARFLLGSALSTLQTEIRTLRERLEAEQLARRDDNAQVSQRIAELEALYDEQRKDKHRIANEYTKVAVLLGVIVDLAEKCTCGALDIVSDLMARVSLGEPIITQPEQGGQQ